MVVIIVVVRNEGFKIEQETDWIEKVGGLTSSQLQLVGQCDRKD